MSWFDWWQLFQTLKMIVAGVAIGGLFVLFITTAVIGLRSSESKSKLDDPTK